MKRKTYVVVNRHVIQRNRKEGRCDPPIRISRGKYGRPEYVHSLSLDGEVKLIYDPENPMPCGAHLWLEFEGGRRGPGKSRP